ncbi:MAG: ATP-binding cassette domain-containing protein [Pseudomonadota bacterium]
MMSPSVPTPVLSVQNLGFSYPGRTVFGGWSHDFSAGLTWIRGHNGCGKSTLLRLFCGALTPSTGDLRIDRTDARTEPLAYRRSVYWSAPDGVAFDHLTPREYFGFIAGLYASFDIAAVGPCVNALGLHPFLDQRISQLSTGTQKKIGLIAALAAGTPVVLLDEPLAALDQAAVAVVRDRLATAAVQRDRVWILTSHEPLGERAEASCRVLDLPAQH